MSRGGIYGVVGLMVVSAALFYFTSTDPVVLLGDGASTRDDSTYVEPNSAVVGQWECLPHAGSGTYTTECAIGLAKEGSSMHYGLDLAAVPDAVVQYTTGTRVRIRGDIVSAEALNTDMWQRYNMAGIIHVTSVTKI